MLSVTLTSGENIYENLTFSENGMIQYITVFKDKNGENLWMAGFAVSHQPLILNLKANCLLLCWFFCIHYLIYPDCNGNFSQGLWCLGLRLMQLTVRREVSSWGTPGSGLHHKSVCNASQDSEGDTGKMTPPLSLCFPILISGRQAWCPQQEICSLSNGSSKIGPFGCFWGKLWNISLGNSQGTTVPWHMVQVFCIIT